jgi:hypothetical protein
MVALAVAVVAIRVILVVFLLIERVVLEAQTFTLLAGVVLEVVVQETPARRGRNL